MRKASRYFDDKMNHIEQVILNKIEDNKTSEKIVMKKNGHVDFASYWFDLT
jgi:protocatechuate 3,4-dioxygenase beta subunit